MSAVGRNGSALVGKGEYALKPPSTGSTLVAFPPIGAKANRPSVRHLGMSERASSSRVSAEVIPFRPRRFVPVAQSSTWALAGEPANIGDERLPGPSDSDRRLRIVEDFLGFAWVAASIAAGYYMLVALSSAS